ncbi:MAG: hypothetical protein JW889_07895 [Verrucomicrobia bacterium]|nr:hypothetical protein [Verrucomicrobiota bacterium]
MHRLFATTALVLLALLLAGTAPAADTVELKLRLDEGTTYKMTMAVTQAITQTAMGQELNIDQTMGFGISFRTTKVDADGAMTVEVRYDSVSFEQDGPMGWTEYDSADPPDEVPMQARAFAGMVGRGFSLKLSPRGQVLDIEGVDKFFDAVMEAMDLPEGPMLDQMKEQLKQQFGEDAMKQQAQMMFAMLPDKPVGVGDSWTDKIDMSGMLPMTVENTCKVTSIDDDGIAIDVESTISPVEGSEPIQMGGASMKMDLSGTQKGSMELSRQSGLPIKAVIDQDIEGTITVSQPGSAEPMSIPITIKSKTTIEGGIVEGDTAPAETTDAPKDAE